MWTGQILNFTLHFILVFHNWWPLSGWEFGASVCFSYQRKHFNDVIALHLTTVPHYSHLHTHYCNPIMQGKITAFAKWKFIYTQLSTNKNCENAILVESSVRIGFEQYNPERRAGMCMRYECEYGCAYRNGARLMWEEEWLAHSIIIRHPKFNSVLLCALPSCQDAGLLLMYLLKLAADGIVLCGNILIRWEKKRTTSKQGNYI